MANLFLKTLPKYTDEIDILICGNFRVFFCAKHARHSEL